MGRETVLTLEQLLEARRGLPPLCRTTRRPKDAKGNWSKLGDIQYKQEIEQADKLLNYDFDE